MTTNPAPDIRLKQRSSSFQRGVMKDYFAYQGVTAITGSRDAIREAFRVGRVQDGEGWMETIAARNRPTQTCDQRSANELAQSIQNPDLIEHIHPVGIEFYRRAASRLS